MDHNESTRIREVKDDEFEGDEHAQKAMKLMLPPLLDAMQAKTECRNPFGWPLKSFFLSS